MCFELTLSRTFAQCEDNYTLQTEAFHTSESCASVLELPAPLSHRAGSGAQTRRWFCLFIGGHFGIWATAECKTDKVEHCGWSVPPQNIADQFLGGGRRPAASLQCCGPQWAGPSSLKGWKASQQFSPLIIIPATHLSFLTNFMKAAKVAQWLPEIHFHRRTLQRKQPTDGSQKCRPFNCEVKSEGILQAVSSSWRTLVLIKHSWGIRVAFYFAVNHLQCEVTWVASACDC